MRAMTANSESLMQELARNKIVEVRREAGAG